MRAIASQNVTDSLAGRWFDYSLAIAGWLHAFPAEQLHVIQVGRCF